MSNAILRVSQPLLALAVAGGLTLPSALRAQGPNEMQASGPRIQSNGPTFEVANPSFTAPEGHVYKAVFEIASGDSDSERPVADLTTVARFLNVHARHGVPDDQVQVAAVFHGPAYAALLTDEAYAERHDGKENPTRDLVRELLDAGVPLVLCGQTAGGRGVTQEDLVPGAQIALSAMTALNVFLSQGYQFNPW